MGSKLAILAAQFVAMTVLVREAAADTTARGLFKQGIEDYKAQKYDVAAATLKQSYELDPKPDVLFALAQAERLGGHCPEAVAHYKKLLESVSDLPTAKVIQNSLALCPQAAAEKPKPAEPASQPETRAPRPSPPITKTVVREVRHTDVLATMLVAGGMLGLGAGGGLFLASRNSQDAADHARTLDDHERFTKQTATERMASMIAGGTGAVMIGIAVVRWARGGEAKSTEVTVAPTANGTMMVVSSRW
jgi:tetratricopeptide (TPR) repeat protein